jgi:hypothetical protein
MTVTAFLNPWNLRKNGEMQYYILMSDHELRGMAEIQGRICRVIMLVYFHVSFSFCKLSTCNSQTQILDFRYISIRLILNDTIQSNFKECNRAVK